MAKEGNPSESKATFLPDTPKNSGPGLRYASGATLRREYVLNARGEYTLAEGIKNPSYVFTKAEEKKKYPKWIKEAEFKYPDNGEYKVDVVTGDATYLGEL